MSIKLMAGVWDLDDPELNNSRLLLLLALADHANDDGFCYPAIPRLAQRARISERQAQRTVQWLTHAGYVEIITKGDGRGHSTVYRLTLKGDISSSNGSGKGDNMSPNASVKDDIMSPNDPTKDDKMSPNMGKKGPNPDKMSSFTARKGDIAMSPDPKLVSQLSSSDPDLEEKTNLLTNYAPAPEQTFEPPDAVETARSFALLIDDTVVGLDAIGANSLAQAYPFLHILAHVCTYRRQLDGKVVNGPGAVINRVRYNFGGAVITEADKQAEWFRRHCPELALADSEAKNYFTEQYGGHVIGDTAGREEEYLEWVDDEGPILPPVRNASSRQEAAL